MLEAKRLCLPDCRAGGGRRGVGGVWIVRLPHEQPGGVYRKRRHAGFPSNAEYLCLAGMVPDGGKKRQANDMATLEVYSAGDPRSPDYESGIWVPLKEV